MSRKNKEIDNIRKWSHEDYEFLIRCMFNYFDSKELEQFAEFIEEENQ